MEIGYPRLELSVSRTEPAIPTPFQNPLRSAKVAITIQLDNGAV